MGRRRIPEHLKKRPSDYPQLAFRLRQEKKSELVRLAKSIAKAKNASRGQADPYWTLGDVFVGALEVGLKKLKG